MTDPTDTALSRVTAAVAAVCPVDGVSVSPGDPVPGVRVDHAPEATPEQQAAAAAVVDGFDWSPEADASWIQEQAVSQAAALMSSTDALPLAVRRWLELLGDWLNELHFAQHGEYRTRADLEAEWYARMTGAYEPPTG